MTKKGVCKGKKAGTATVTAWTKIGKRYEPVSSCSVTVEKPVFTPRKLTVTIDPAKAATFDASAYLTGLDRRALAPGRRGKKIAVVLFPGLLYTIKN